jgi:hypothetical protein
VGTLIQNVGVLRITRVESGAVLADIEKQYTAVLEGDLIRLRDPQRLRYYALLRQGPPAADFNVKGEVAGLIPPSLFAIKGDVVYLSVGHDQGVTPGMRLMVVREHVLLSGPDDSNDMMPMGPTEPTLAQGDDLRELQPTGRIGVLEVVNTSRNASAARVVQCVGEVRAGDSVRYR